MLHGRLEPASLRVMEQHVAMCSQCRELLSALAQIETLVPPGASGEPAGVAGDSGIASTAPQTDDQAELGSGERIGRYVVARPLGAGAMGEVYAAHDPELDRKVALKILRRDGLACGERERVQDRLRREAQAMAQLAHPNVVAVHDVGNVGDHIFIAMEFVEGDTLAAWLTAEPRSWRAVVSMFVSAGEGLAAAHAAGIVHHDFKPENVLVGRDGRARVADFGLARMLAPEEPDANTERDSPEGISQFRTSTRWLAGTPYYMAPEQFL